MTHCNREPSPVLRRKEKERCMELLTDEEKVHRIDLRTPAICRLAHVESPNCVWFKLVNNISEDLRIIRPLEPLIPKRNKNIENCNGNQYNIILQSSLSTDLTSSNNLTGKKSIDEVIISEEEEQILKHQKNNSMQLYDYVLAPLEANVYARARIIQLKKINFHSYGQNKFKIFSYVHFIDEGFGVWLNTKCLAKMVPNMYTHPWQAFSVSLFRVKLGNGLDGSSPNSLSSSLTNTLIDIMSNYEYFKVIPVIDSRRYPDYYEYTRAEIYGLETLEDSEGSDGKAESIIHRFLIELPDIGRENKPDDSKFISNQIENLTLNGSTSTYDPLFLDKTFDRDIFDAKQHSLIREKNNYWTPDLLAEIPKWRMKWPKDFWNNSHN